MSARRGKKGRVTSSAGPRGGRHNISTASGYVDQDVYYVKKWLEDKIHYKDKSPWGDRLIAGPFVGEFGWELFGWQGRVRYLSQFFSKTTVICRKGFSYLYKDFADECEEYAGSLAGETSGPLLRNFQYQNEISYDKVKDLRILPQTQLVDYNWRKSSQGGPFKNQSFVKYGEPGAREWDVLFHARATHKASSEYRNWQLDSWKSLSSLLSSFRLASVGAAESSMHVPGPDDLRGISLESLSTTMRNSAVTVGPSSGPIHFAALCGCPQVTWFGAPWGVANVRRYHDWNPFRVLNVAIYDVEWNPDPRQVAFEAKSILGLGVRYF